MVLCVRFLFKSKISEESVTANNLKGKSGECFELSFEMNSSAGAAAIRKTKNDKGKLLSSAHRGKFTYIRLKNEGWALERHPF